MLKSILISTLLLTAVLRSQAQVFAGAGLSGTPVSDIGLYGASGFSLMLEKDFSLSKSTRWKMHPSLHVSFLFSEIDRPSPSYLNIISVSPKISYEVISGKGIKVAPYAGPFVSRLWGIKGIIFGADPIGTFIGGLEWGIRIDIKIGKTSTVRFIPFAIQVEKEGLYTQATMFSLLLSL